MSDGQPRAIADVSAGLILATVTIAASPERVFHALTDPTELPRWWGSDELYRTTNHVADVRPGGKWRSEGKGSDGEPFAVEGEYLEIDPPRRLVMTWKPGWDEGSVTTVTYLLEPTANGTKLTLRHEGFGETASSCSNHATGWPLVFEWLRAYLEPQAALQVFFCRLKPPRPDFATTLTEKEAAAMKAHGEYLKGLLSGGTAVLFGPVADPAGIWGLGIFKASDEGKMRAISEADPAIKAGIGLRYEILPMIAAVM
ncbi:SRPBCC domain-containing protein [Mesorhizobium sp. BAC0120]|uniref:SRPBCC domain-containing protein n=1 Tax=Mesorhizobium sp. BAC0120 TaxID=3090670 RepID=UPI00298C5E4B|nr:SRPBCC domain-containing protein [Mesorhizobium sp. BAC0120]MDW6024075.1 SRPBCC domain-containing protein [Mesorhizobium sp. BAC0120]